MWRNFRVTVLEVPTETLNRFVGQEIRFCSVLRRKESSFDSQHSRYLSSAFQGFSCVSDPPNGAESSRKKAGEFHIVPGPEGSRSHKRLNVGWQNIYRKPLVWTAQVHDSLAKVIRTNRGSSSKRIQVLRQRAGYGICGTRPGTRLAKSLCWALK